MSSVNSGDGAAGASPELVRRVVNSVEGADKLCAKAEQGVTGIPACDRALGYTDKNVCATLYGRAADRRAKIAAAFSNGIPHAYPHAYPHASHPPRCSRTPMPITLTTPDLPAGCPISELRKKDSFAKIAKIAKFRQGRPRCLLSIPASSPELVLRVVNSAALSPRRALKRQGKFGADAGAPRATLIF